MTPIRVQRYGVWTWEDPAMDSLRRKRCLCLRCARLKPDQRDNCTMAEVQFALCQTQGVAQMVTRCAQFRARNPDGESVSMVEDWP